MSLTRRLMPSATALLTSPRTRALRRGLAELSRRVRGEPQRVHFFHQVDDPYSHLAAQVLHELLRRYDVELEPHLVGPPPDEAAPERARLEAFARKDAADVAPAYGLHFPEAAPVPDPARVELATRILARTAHEDFARVAPRVSHALWSGDAAELEKRAAEHGAASASAAQEAVARGDALRRRLGHYLGAMFYYGGEWSWGVDRLHHLERHLQARGLLRPGADPAPIAPRPDFHGEPAVPAPEAGPLALDFFLSLRSPYTAIAMPRLLALPERLSVELHLRPVLPMVMRGLPVPPAKRRYILLDTRREADDAGVPFGRICDPVGRPVERAFTLLPFARERGRAGAFLHAFTRASFAEGVDTGADAGLRYVLESAGLSWHDARAHLDRDDAVPELEANRKELLALGLWGVPSFRLRGPRGEPDFCTWGQDRIWRVEAEIRRRVAALRPS